MKKHYYSILFLMIFIFSNKIIAQNTCGTPFPINSTTNYTYTAITSTPNTDATNNYGCIAPANNATWFYFQACTAGNVSIIFSNAPGTSSADVDFIIYGPLSAPTDCGLTSGQILDCSAAVGPMDTLNISGVTVGSYYKLLVSNPANMPGGYSFGAVGFLGSFDSICSGCSGPPPVQEICQVTTDPVINHNIIIWNKDTTYTGSYIVQKESTILGVYTTIATVINSDTSAYVDSVSNPMIQSFIYRIGTSDTCGNMSFGSIHQTIHLLTSISPFTGYPQLSWNAYAGFSYGTYFIYRGASPASLTIYDSISASFNTYTDVTPATGMSYYAISVYPPSACHPSRSMLTEHSFSNLSPATYTGINEYEFANLSVAPNPANDVLNFTLGNVSADVTIDIIDITGRLVLSRSFKNVSQDVIGLNEISNGSYVVRFTSESGTAHKNIVVVR